MSYNKSVFGDFFNTPNTLSLIRILATPVLILLLLNDSKVMSIVTAVIFVIVSATDWLDGYLARKLNEVTAIGKFLDPLADKLLIITALIMLVDLDRAPSWMVALIVAREITITGLRTVAMSMGVVIAASPLGKIKTVVQIVAITPLIVHYTWFGIDFQMLGMWLFYAAFIFTIWSGVDYIYKFFTSEEVKTSD